VTVGLTILAILFFVVVFGALFAGLESSGYSY